MEALLFSSIPRLIPAFFLSVILKRNMLFGAYRPIIDYLEYFGLTDKVGQLFAETLPSLTSSMTSLI